MQLFAALVLAAASVTGAVTSDEHALPGCTVVLTSASAEKRTVISDVEGAYRFAAVPPGDYTLRFQLTGFETGEHAITVVADSTNTQPVEDLKLDPTQTTITVSCTLGSPCNDDPPESVWENPTCADYDLDESLIAAIDRGDRSALDLVRQRYHQAPTYAQKHRLAAVLLRLVPNDSVYWNELLEHARRVVHFADSREEFEQWCSERELPPDEYWWMGMNALIHAGGDPRARPLLLDALKTHESSILSSAVFGLAHQHDEAALPAIEQAFEANPDQASGFVFLLQLYESDAADQLAYRYLDEDGRAAYDEERGKPAISTQP